MENRSPQADSNVVKAVVIALVAAAVVAAVAVKERGRGRDAVGGAPIVEPAAAPPAEEPAGTPEAPSAATAPDKAPAGVPKALPRFVELGSETCVPCRMMAPIVEELRESYKGRLQVEFVDVFKDRRTAEKHRVRVIPTQVFIDPSGREVFRHEGFFAKEEILAKWRELGVDLGSGTKDGAR